MLTKIKKLLTPNKETVLQAIFRSSFINLFARLFGYLKQVTIAVLVGFNLNTDSFFLALGLLGLFLTFTDVFDSLGIPNLVRARQKSYEEFTKLAGVLFTFTTILAVVITLLAILLTPVVVQVAFGYTESEKELLKEYFLLLIPYLFFSFFFHHFGAIHRSLRHFTVYFIGELLFSFFSFLFILIGLLLFSDPKVLPVSISLAQFVASVYMVLVSKPFWEFRFYIDRTVKGMLKQFVQLLVIYSTFHLYMLVDRVFASFLPPKSISALSYGWMVAMIPRGLFKFENIVITSLSEVNADWNKVKFYLLRIFLLGLTFSILIFLLAPYLIKFLFGYGKFSFLDMDLTITATQIYAFALPFVFLWNVIYKIYQIRGKLLHLIFPVIVSIFANSFLNYLFIFDLNKGLEGISLATDLAYSILFLISWYLLKKEVDNAKMSNL